MKGFRRGVLKGDAHERVVDVIDLARLPLLPVQSVKAPFPVGGNRRIRVLRPTVKGRPEIVHHREQVVRIHLREIGLAEGILTQAIFQVNVPNERVPLPTRLLLVVVRRGDVVVKRRADQRSRENAVVVRVRIHLEVSDTRLEANLLSIVREGIDRIRPIAVVIGRVRPPETAAVREGAACRTRTHGKGVSVEIRRIVAAQEALASVHLPHDRQELEFANRLQIFLVGDEHEDVAVTPVLPEQCG